MRPIDIILIVLAVIMMIMLWRIIVGRKRRQTQRRIARIHERNPGDGKRVQESLRRKTIEQKGLIYWITKPLPDSKYLGVLLERAGKTVTPKQYVFRRALSFLIIVFVVSVIFKKTLLLGIPLGVALGVWLPLKYLQYIINKQNRAFLQLFPDAIDLIVRGLRSGLPVTESLVLVSQEVPEPVGGIFARISNTMKLGVPLDKALQETAKKLDISEFNFFTTSILLQRETGGNLSEILSNLSEVLRARIIMRMKIKAMSSEARASTVIIGSLPFVVILAVGVITPGYMTPLFDDYRGNIWLAIAAGMMGTGLWIMRRMSRFEI